jgi:cell shape-determining protein MreC
MERERKHFESETGAKAKQIEEAIIKTKKLNSENESLKMRVAELEQEIVEREACEAQVQEYVKQLIANK